MHEMPVAQHVLNLALQAAGGGRVTDIYLRVGELSAIVSSSVEIFFAHLSKGTQAEGARLHFEMAPPVVSCGECGRPADLSRWRDLPPMLAVARALAAGCPCGGRQLRVTDGSGFAVTEIVVEDSL
ncbi:MAG: hydrogenase maturation nickel metallochaperone HypA [Anaerolineae bacterium]|nr:hydrogenase maturation nickel metallochaperone HypA [Anaerolineae bacterium]